MWHLMYRAAYGFYGTDDKSTAQTIGHKYWSCMSGDDQCRYTSFGMML